MAANAELNLVIGVVDKASGGLKKIAGGLGTLGKVAGGLALGGLGLATAGVGALSAALVGGIADARGAAKVFAQTQAVIKSTGGAAGFTADQIADMAGSLSAASGKSLFGDDDIQRGQNMLLTFTNIKETLPDATQTMLDMATAMGTDAESGAVALGKALNDPIAGISALSRVGVTFSEDQKKVIERLVETGDVAGAQKVILAELNKEFGGSAQAAADADGGFAQFQDRMGELAESIGARVLPMLNSLLGWLNSPEVQGAITAFVDGLFNGLTRIGQIIGPVIGWFADLGKALIFQGEWSSSWLETFTTLGGEILTKLGEIGTSVLNWIIEQAPIWGAQLVTWGQQFIAWVSPYIPPLLAKLGELATAAWNWVAEQAPILLAQLGEWGVQLVAWVLPQIPVLLENLGTVIADVIAWIGEQIPKIDEAVRKWGDELSQWIDEVAIPQIGPAFARFDAEMGRLLTNFISHVSEKAAEAARAFVTNLVQGFIDGLPGFRDITLAEWSDAIFNWLNETAPKVIPGAKAIATSIIDAIRKKQAELIPMLDGWATDIHTWLTDTAASVLSWAVDVGTNMVTGMVNGVIAQATSLANAAAKVVRDAVQAAKDAIFSNSPSRLTRDEIGIPIMEGIQWGIEDGLPNLRYSLISGLRQIIDEAEGMARNIPRSFFTQVGDNGRYGYNPPSDPYPVRYLPPDNGRDYTAPPSSRDPLRYLPPDNGRDYTAKTNNVNITINATDRRSAELGVRDALVAGGLL